MDDPFEGNLRAEVEVALMKFREANEKVVAKVQAMTEVALQGYADTGDLQLRRGLYFTLAALQQLTNIAAGLANDE
jgi:hypothetical protein